MALTAKQQRFVEEYLVDLNAAQAAIRAGYKEKTARQQGQRLLTNADIEAAISAGQEKRSERTEITQDKVLRELARIGFSDLRGVFTPMGHLLPPEEWPDDLARAVSSVEVVTRPGAEVDENGNREVEYVHKFRLWDKNSALDKIGKHLAMFTERVDHSSSDGSLAPQVIDASGLSDAALQELMNARKSSAETE